jgi:hypothetical protein
MLNLMVHKLTIRYQNRGAQSGCQVAVATEFCAVARNVCGSSEWYFWRLEFGGGSSISEKFVSPCTKGLTLFAAKKRVIK